MKQPVKVRTPNEISESEGPKSTRSIYLDDELLGWIDRVRGKASRSAVINEAIRCYRQHLDSANNGKPKSGR
jgi:metal-responsive CopG/Arc/MetJ family transcriptional regulator